jgi:hypothetical protein
LEKAPGTDDLAATAAGGTIDGTGSGFGAAAGAFAAGVELPNLNFFLSAHGCFLERDLHVIAQV